MGWSVEGGASPERGNSCVHGTDRRRSMRQVVERYIRRYDLELSVSFTELVMTKHSSST